MEIINYNLSIFLINQMMLYIIKNNNDLQMYLFIIIKKF